jgi:hypothetical protein
MTFDVIPKRAGFCSLCDVPIITVTQEWTDEEKRGEPREVSGIEPGAKMTTLVLLSGANMDWGFCKNCNLRPADIPRVWKRMLAAGVLEISPEWRAARNLEPYTAEQEQRAIETVVGYFANPPLGILGSRFMESA